MIGLAALTGITAMGGAQAEDDESKLYWRIGAGAVFAEDFDESFERAPLPEGAVTCAAIGCRPDQRILEFDTGFALGGALGYHFGKSIRGEIEYRYSKNEMSKARSLEGGTEGFGPAFPDTDFTTHSGFANVYYDFHNESRFTPFIGVGLGFTTVDEENWESNTAIAYQGRVGVSTDLNERFLIDTEYVYHRTGDIELVDRSAGAAFATSNILVSLRGSF